MKASSKRRRSKAQIEEEKLTAQQREMEVEQRLAQMDAMQQQMQAMQQQLAEAEDMRQKAFAQRNEVQGMFEEGLLKRTPDGQYQVVDDSSERESIKQEVIASKRKHAMTAEEASEFSKQLDQLNDEDDEQDLG